jgi:hypothetical protein
MHSTARVANRTRSRHVPDTETTVVFRVLGILARANDEAHSLVLNEIADAANLDELHA